MSFGRNIGNFKWVEQERERDVWKIGDAMFSGKRAIRIDSNVEVIRLFKKKNNANIWNIHWKKFKIQFYNWVKIMNKNSDVSLSSIWSTSLFSFADPFLVEGVAVQEFFHHEKENYSQEKELEKARKQLARGQTPTMTHAQGNIKRLEMSSKTPGRQQTHLGKEVRHSSSCLRWLIVVFM